ncbi:MAG: BrnA antitoxin family protein [Magnetococcales bacterium]|nr:BrnA antitoxin family protein [Magnetococcales bacterium]
MNANKPDTTSTWVDPDDAPELTDDWFQQADLYRDGQLIRRGRPANSGKKVSTTVRFNAEIITAFRATGKGWQTRMNDALADWLKTHSPSQQSI